MVLGMHYCMVYAALTLALGFLPKHNCVLWRYIVEDWVSFEGAAACFGSMIWSQVGCKEVM